MVIGELDRETQDLYELTIVARDNGEPSRNVRVLALFVYDSTLLLDLKNLNLNDL